MKNRKTFKILTSIGIIGLAGLQWFYLNQYGKGFKYMFTVGMFWAGTINNLVLANDIVDKYNATRGFINTDIRNTKGF